MLALGVTWEEKSGKSLGSGLGIGFWLLQDPQKSGQASEQIYLGHVDAVVYPITQIHVKPPRLTKQGFVAGGAAAVAVTGGLVLGIRLRFHNHAPQQLASGLALHQQAADEFGGDDLGGAGEEGLGEVGGYGGGLDEVADAILLPTK